MANRVKKSDIAQLPLKKAAIRHDIDFGKAIRTRRLQLGIEQEQLGRACGVTGNTIGNWERGVARPNVSLVPMLCELLGISLYTFFGMKDPDAYTGDEKSLILDYRSLTKPNRRQLRKIICAIQDSQQEARREQLLSEYTVIRGHECGLAAGFGTPMADEHDVYPVFVRANRISARADDIFYVNGRSMEPTYPDGSMVYIKRVDPNLLSYGDTVACIASASTYIKIYERDGLHSINPEFSTIHITDDDNIRLIGRVIGLVREEDLPTKDEAAELREAFSDRLGDMAL